MLASPSRRWPASAVVVGCIAFVGCGGDSSRTVTLGALAADGATEFDVVMTVDGEEVLNTTATDRTEREVEVSGDFSITVDVVNRSDTGIVRCGIDQLLSRPVAGNGEVSVTCSTRGSIDGRSIEASSDVEPVARPGTPVEVAAFGTIRVPEGYEVGRSVDPGREDEPVLAAGEEWVEPSYQLLLRADETGPGGGELLVFRETDPAATSAAAVAEAETQPAVDTLGEREIGDHTGVLLQWEGSEVVPDQLQFYADVAGEVLIVVAITGASLDDALADLEALVASVPIDAGS